MAKAFDIDVPAIHRSGRLGGLCGVALVLALPSCDRPGTVPTPDVPRLYAPTTEKDLGEIGVCRSGHEVSFPLFNRGSADLTIDRLVTSCTCTGASVSRSVLGPGEETSVRVRIAPRQGEEKAASVIVQTNDPLRPKTVLVVRWRAVADVEFDPLTLDFGTVMPGERTEQTVRLVRRTGVTSSVERIEAVPADRLSAVAADSSVRVALTPETSRGDGAGRVTLFLTPGGEPESLSLPVRWKVRDFVEAEPESVYLGSGRPGDDLQAALVVTARDGKEVVIRNLSLRGFFGRATWRRIAPNRAVVSLMATLPTATGPAGGELTIECSSPEPRTLRIPVSAFVSGGEVAAGGSP